MILGREMKKKSRFIIGQNCIFKFECPTWNSNLEQTLLSPSSWWKKNERPSMNPVDASCTAAAKESSALQAGSKCMNYRGAKIGKSKEKGKSCRIGKPVCQLMKKKWTSIHKSWGCIQQCGYYCGGFATEKNTVAALRLKMHEIKGSGNLLLII